jgi:hypothetical protein
MQTQAKRGRKSIFARERQEEASSKRAAGHANATRGPLHLTLASDLAVHRDV